MTLHEVDRAYQTTQSVFAPSGHWALGTDTGPFIYPYFFLGYFSKAQLK